jgi:hypothetical protein
MASFPELQGESTTGKTKMWSIKVTELNTVSGPVGVIETTHGYVDGKKQVTKKLFQRARISVKRMRRLHSNRLSVRLVALG